MAQISYKHVWTQINEPKDWSYIATSSDGTKLIASVFEDCIYTSNDFGVSWTKCDSLNNFPKGWYRVASSSDGSTLVATNNRVYISVDYGVRWNEKNPLNGQDGLWNIILSPNGENIISLEQMRILLKNSTDTETTWDKIFKFPNSEIFTCKGFTASLNGNDAILILNSNLVKLKKIGTRWERPINIIGEQNWTYIASSENFTNIIVCSNKNIYISNNSGSSWTLAGPLFNEEHIEE
jgi:hypothetical protein